MNEQPMPEALLAEAQALRHRIDAMLAADKYLITDYERRVRAFTELMIARRASDDGLASSPL